jgi:hypothetical protein
MSYSTTVLWLEMAVLTCCVALSIKKRNKPAMWVALAIVAHQAALIVSREDQLLFDVVVSALIYLGLVKISANAARVWLCAGGALAGALFLGGTGLSIIGLFQDGWNVFGLMLWATPVFAAPGLLVGFWVVYRWTEPAEAAEGPLHR